MTTPEVGMHHLMGTAEIAELMGVSRQRVAQIANGDSGFPAPVATLKGGSVWERAAVEQWMEHNAKEQPPRRVGIFNRMDDDARRSIVRAQEESRRLGHAFIGTEHLLLGVLQSETDPVVRRLVAAELPSIEAVRDWISERIPPSEEPPGSHVPFTPRSKQVLEATVTLAGRAGAITTATLLLALASDKNGVAAQALNHFDVSVDKIEGYSEFPEPGPISQRQSGTYDERTAKRLGEVAAYLRGIAEELQQSPTPEVELIEHGAPKESEDWRSLIRCSFCSKPRAEVTKIIAGPGCYICNECVDLCNEIIAEGQEHD